MSYEGLSRYICQEAYGGSFNSIQEVNPFGQMPPGYALLSEQVVQFQCQNSFPAPLPFRPLPSVCSVKKFPLDWDKCFVLNLLGRQYMCNEPNRPSDLCIKHKTSLINDDDIQEGLVKMGNNAKNCFAHISYTGKDQPKDMEKAIIIQETSRGYFNPGFIASLAIVDESNLMHGIRRIPHERCKELGLTVGKTPPPEMNPLELQQFQDRFPELTKEKLLEKMQESWKRKQIEKHQVKTFDEVPDVKYWVIIPSNHILAWILRDTVFAQRYHFYPEKLQLQNEATKEWVVFFFFVRDYEFDRLKAGFESKWLGKTEHRPFNSIDIKFVEPDGKIDPNYDAHVSVSLKCYVPPKGLTSFAHIAPVVAPNMPDPQLEQVDQVAIQMNSLLL